MIRELAVLAEAARPELLAWVLASMRVLPVTLLCPVLGGQLVPAPARLAVAGALGLTLRPLVGVLPPTAPELLDCCAREAAVGRRLDRGGAPAPPGASGRGRAAFVITSAIGMTGRACRE